MGKQHRQPASLSSSRSEEPDKEVISGSEERNDILKYDENFMEGKGKNDSMERENTQDSFQEKRENTQDDFQEEKENTQYNSQKRENDDIGRENQQTNNEIEEEEYETDAIKGEESNEWKRAIEEELEALRRNHTWTEVDLPPNKTPIETKKKFYRAKKLHEKEINLLQTENEKLKARQEVMEVAMREVYTDCKKDAEKRMIKKVTLKIGEKFM
ncbi:unnamed protein product [Arctia plantaginis]|uniref:Uncharacterized protein n=1 Tax=Arctia plantaginis TaxID=874455 RepID=A0A8S1ANE4_ARCPL|nr:unnamed protein product [Arctia plantaginis]